MKKTNRSLTLVLSFCLFIKLASAQVFPDVTPDNIDETVDLIFELYGSGIENDYATVYDFLDDLLPDDANDPEYDDSCPPPDPVIDDANTATISMSWDVVPGAYNYEASFIKLNQFPSTGIESGSVTTPNTNVQFVVSNGLILMAFQTRCFPGRIGRLSIIIVDKPVFFSETQADCQCENPGIPETKAFGFEAGSASFPYAHEGIAYYKGVIENGEVNSAFLISVNLEEGETIVSKRNDCVLYLFNDVSNTMLNNKEGDDTDIILGVLTFSDGITFNPSFGRTGSFTLTKCLDGRPKDKSGRPRESDWEVLGKVSKINVVPNPARDFVSITVPADVTIEDCHYFIIDAIGNQIHLPSIFSSVENGVFNLSIDHLPIGIYSFVIQDKNKIMKTRFIKIE